MATFTISQNLELHLKQNKMRTTIIVLLLGFSSVVLAYVPDPRGLQLDNRILYLADGHGGYRTIDPKDTKLEVQAGLEDLTYYLYTRNNIKQPIQIKNNSLTPLNHSVFDSKKQIIFLIHGWLNNGKSSFNTLLTDAILDTHDVNVFVVDWGEIAYKNYFTSRFSVTTLGKLVGEYLNLIVAHFNISYKDITLIGHSLGAHMSGVAGSTCKQTVDLIIGMDAALPFYFSHDPAGRLDQTDADFVHVIHTNAGMLGYLKPIGHADYYPNGGTYQPGCFLDIVGGCAHGRGYEYLAESMRSKDREFGAYKCDQYLEFEDGTCVVPENRSLMGRLEVDRTARGTYYLDTNSKHPYAKDIID